MKKLYTLFLLLPMMFIAPAVAADDNPPECGKISTEESCRGTAGCGWYTEWASCKKCQENQYGLDGVCHACSELKDANGKSYWENAAEGSAQNKCYADCDEIVKNMTNPEHGTWELTRGGSNQVLTETASYPNKCDISLVCDTDETNVCASYHVSSDNATCTPAWTILGQSEIQQSEIGHLDNATQAIRLMDEDKNAVYFATKCQAGYVITHAYDAWGPNTINYPCVNLNTADGTLLNTDDNNFTMGICKEEKLSCSDFLYPYGWPQNDDETKFVGEATLVRTYNEYKRTGYQYDLSKCQYNLGQSDIVDANKKKIGTVENICTWVSGTYDETKWKCEIAQVISCVAGYYENNKTCIPVGVGYYSPTGDKGRYPCPPGKTTSGVTTAASESACEYVAGPGGTRFCDNLGCFTIPAGARIVEIKTKP